MTGSGLLVLNAIQPVRLFVRLIIGDSQLFCVNPRCCPNPNSYEIQWDLISIKK